jgi:branched-subunit amino acid aminotransferase/4-amino-4-deoxychorismate lyase
MSGRIEVNGRPATGDELGRVARVNYGHFTSLQVRAGRARGLDLHLARLDAATRELFGSPLDRAATQHWMRQLAGDGDTSLRVAVHPRAFERDRPGRSMPVDVLVETSPPRSGVQPPRRVRSLRFQRDAPHVKHVGTFPLWHQRRQAQLAGYDDALFLHDGDAIAEGTLWNIGLLDAEGVTWPDAPALDGTSRQLLHAAFLAHGLRSVRRRVSLSELGGFEGAFATNAGCLLQPLGGIDAIPFDTAPARFASLEAAIASIPGQPL